MVEHAEPVPSSRSPAGTAPTSPAPSVPVPVGRVQAFDGLRGVCALMILFHHVLLTQPAFADYEWHVPRHAPLGWAAWLLVATPLRLAWAGQERALLFFVLSGFVLSLPWLEGRAAPFGRFLLGRFCRIYPPYLAAMALAAAASALLGGHPLPAASVYVRDLGWVHRPSWATLFSVVAVLNNRSSEYINEAAWSLVWEARVALVLPLLIVAAARWGNRALPPLFALLLVCARLANHAVSHWAPPGLSAVLNAPQDTFRYAELFLFGVAVAVNRDRIAARAALGNGWPGVGLLAVGCVVCWIPWPVERERLVGVGAALVLVSALGSTRVQGWLTRPALLWLGRQSYSLYLVHVPLIMVAVIAFGGAVPLAAFLLIAPAIVAAAELFRVRVERPAVRMAQNATGYREGTAWDRERRLAASVAVSGAVSV